MQVTPLGVLGDHDTVIIVLHSFYTVSERFLGFIGMEHQTHKMEAGSLSQQLIRHLPQTD